MNIAYGEVVDRIQNSLNSVSKDTFIPRRFILSIFKSKLNFLMAQKFHDKSLFRETNLFKWIECVSMEEIDTVKCGKIELQKCNTTMKSVKKLPEMIWTRYGSTLLMVTNIDGSKEYQVISHSYYNSLRKRRGFDKFKGKYAILYPDNHLYIPDSTVSIVNVLLYSLDEKCNDLSDCEENNCNSYWDFEVEVSDKVYEAAISETFKEVFTRLQIPKDELPNGDSNQKTLQPQ